MIVGGAVILAIGFFLRSTAYAALGDQAMTTGGVALVIGIVLLAIGTLIRR